MYEIAFAALADIGDDAVPFCVITHIELKGNRKVTLYFEDLITGKKKQLTGVFSNHKTSIVNPLTKKGPYFVNRIEDVVRGFRQD